MNAVFALGEIGPPARSSITKIAKLLNHELQQIVRQALDALIFIGGDLLIVLPKIQNLLRTNNPNWQESLVQRGWNGVIIFYYVLFKFNLKTTAVTNNHLKSNNFSLLRKWRIKQETKLRLKNNDT